MPKKLPTKDKKTHESKWGLRRVAGWAEVNGVEQAARCLWSQGMVNTADAAKGGGWAERNTRRRHQPPPASPPLESKEQPGGEGRPPK